MTEQPIPPADEQVLEALAAAYSAGATDTHNWWAAGNVEREADFGEAASDYARSIDLAALAMRPAPDAVLRIVQKHYAHIASLDREAMTDAEREQTRGAWNAISAVKHEIDALATSPAPDAVLRENEPVCQIPPAGWYCTRHAGHDGPCAARPIDPLVQVIRHWLMSGDYPVSKWEVEFAAAIRDAALASPASTAEGEASIRARTEEKGHG